MFRNNMGMNNNMSMQGMGMNNNVFYGQQMPQQMQMQVRTNKMFVTSVEDAMARYADYNTEIVYFHQDLPLLIEVKTDMQGKKTCNLFDISTHTENKAEAGAVVGLTREEVAEICRQEIQNAIDKKKSKTVGESKIAGRIE